MNAFIRSISTTSANDHNKIAVFVENMKSIVESENEGRSYSFE